MLRFSIEVILRRYIIPLVIMTAFLGLLHWFIFLAASRDLSRGTFWFALALVVGAFLMPASLLIGMTKLHNKLTLLILAGHVWMGIFTIAFFFSLVQVVLNIFSVPLHSSWVLFATLLVSIWSLRINLTEPKVITHKISGPDFLKGYRVLQISDLHIGMPTLRQAWLQKVVNRIKTASADLVVVTGDLVDAPFDEVSPMLEPLMQIKVPKFYVTGNHEYIRGGDWETRLRSLGFHVLHNSHHIISRHGENLLIGGVPDRMVKGFRTGLESNPEKALSTSENIKYKILLAHEPSSVFDLKKEKCDLILSGHTHGGQIFPFGIFVRMVQPVIAGFKTINGIRVFAHQGTGFWGPPMRWLTRSEIVIFEWV